MSDRFQQDLIRTIIGFEKLISNGFKIQSFPKYEILKKEDQYKVRILLAGYKKEEIDVSVEDNFLTVKHERPEDSVEDNDGFVMVTEKSIATRQFNFKIAIYQLEVKDATFNNGILEILLENKQKTDKIVINL